MSIVVCISLAIIETSRDLRVVMRLWEQEVGYGCPSARATAILTSLAAETEGLTLVLRLFLDFGWFNSSLFRLLELMWLKNPGNINTNWYETGADGISTFA